MKQVTLRKNCTNCEEGELVSTGLGTSNSITTYWEHRCKHCNFGTKFQECYPNTFIEFEEHETEERWE